MSYGFVNSAAGQHSAGSRLNRMLDSLGLPDQVGDLMGAALDARMGNVAGMRRNLFDAFNRVRTGQIDARGRAGLPSFGRIPSPLSMLGMLRGSPLLGAFAAPGALSLLASAGPMGAAGGMLGRMALGMAAGGGVGGGASGANPLDTSGSDIRSIVNNPNLSIEEKMSLALMKMAEKQEQKLEDQLQKMSGKSQAGGAGGGGGIFGKIAGIAGGFMAGGPIGAVMGAVGSLFGGGAGGAGGAGGKKESEQIQAQKLQMIQQKMSRLLDTLSNVMKSFHQTASTAIRNIN